MRQALAWAMDHDPAVALQLAVALAPWWLLRGRLADRVPAAARRRRPCRGGQRDMVHRTVLAWPCSTSLGRSCRGAWPLHSDP